VSDTDLRPISLDALAGAAAPRLNRRTALIAGAGAALVLGAGLLMPVVVRGASAFGLIFDAVMFAFLTMSIAFLVRHLGIVSLGHTAFFGGSAYTVAIATTVGGMGMIPAAALGLLVGVVLAVLMGAIVVRASGMTFMMLTLALGQAVYQVVVLQIARPWTGASDGTSLSYIAGDSFFGVPPDQVVNPVGFWPVVWIVFVLSIVALWFVGRMKFGRVLQGIRENEERMRFSGYDTVRPRFLAFVVSGTVASIGGVLFALNASYVSPELLSFFRSGDALIATLLGGTGLLVGPVVGALIYMILLSTLNSTGNLQLYLGAALVIVLAFLPTGVTGAIVTGVKRLWRRIRRKGPM